MKVSVITAVRNGDGTIGDTVASVTRQSYADVEHVIVDGESTDRTMEVVASHARRPGPVICEADSGIYDAFNKGWNVASGDVVGYLNADDVYIDSRAVERVVEVFSARNVDMVFADVVQFRNDKPGQIVRYYSSARFAPYKIRFGLMPAHPAFFVRRECLSRTGGFDQSYQIAGDFELLLRLFIGMRATYVHLPRVLVGMRVGGASTRGWQSTQIISSEMLRACRENGVRTNRALVMGRLPIKLMQFFRRPPHDVCMSAGRAVR